MVVDMHMFWLMIFSVSLGFSFWNTKIKLFPISKFFEKGLKKKKGFPILRIRSDRGGEFVNQLFMTYCDEKGTIGLGLWYPKTGDFSMISYSMIRAHKL